MPDEPDEPLVPEEPEEPDEPEVPDEPEEPEVFSSVVCHRIYSPVLALLTTML